VQQRGAKIAFYFAVSHSLQAGSVPRG
jgi:hypothetical protein